MCKAPYYDAKRKTLSFSTLFVSQFNVFSPIFFEKGSKKGIATYFQNNPISSITLAYWFMDDGGLLSYNRDYPRRALVFNTQAFGEPECKILSNNINLNHDLHSWVKKDKKYFVIVIPAERADLCCEIVKPYMIDSMKHKLRLHKEG